MVALRKACLSAKDNPQGSVDKLWLIPLALRLAAGIENIASAQIVPDNTLPQNSIVTPDGGMVEISGGTTQC